MLHAGGKFGGGGYKVSGGLHGVGVSVVNALSSRLRVDVKKNGKVYTQSFTVGVPDADLAEVGTSDANGTTITFWASPDVFETTTYSYETLSTRFREMAFLNKGLEIVIRDERPDHTEDGEPGRAVVQVRRRPGRLREVPDRHPRDRAPRRDLVRGGAAARTA